MALSVFIEEAIQSSSHFWLATPFTCGVTLVEFLFNKPKGATTLIRVNHSQQMISQTRAALKRLQGHQGPLVTRFAPSPTGYLHLGHVGHMLFVWGLAQEIGAKIVLRIEDHDQSRYRSEYLTSLLEDLDWLGFASAHGFSVSRRPSEYLQSDIPEIYEGCLEKLIQQNLVYSCQCTRNSELSFAVGKNKERRYLGSCRHLALPLDTPNTCLRVKLDDQPVMIDDLWQGSLVQHPTAQCGDPVIRDRLNQWSYYFAVVVDDLRHHISLIIRGQDLLHTCARQLLLRKLLSPDALAPLFLHHPLIMDHQGKKLSKRSYAEAIAVKRRNKVSARELIGQAAYHIGLKQDLKPCSLDELIEKVFYEQ